MARQRPKDRLPKPGTAKAAAPKNTLRTVFRWVLLIGAIVAFNLLASYGVKQFLESPLGSGAAGGVWMGFAVLALYAVLLAIPFMPGVEIGISLLVMQGAAMVPYVYLATLAGLLLAYSLGHAFSEKFSCKFLGTLGLHSACAFIDKTKAMPRRARLAMLEAAVPARFAGWLIAHRYLMIALLINIPGNSLIGGGGGILMVAGLSRVFSFPATVLTLAIATAPIPLAVYFFGVDLLN